MVQWKISWIDSPRHSSLICRYSNLNWTGILDWILLFLIIGENLSMK